MDHIIESVARTNPKFYMAGEPVRCSEEEFFDYFLRNSNNLVIVYRLFTGHGMTIGAIVATSFKDAESYLKQWLDWEGYKLLNKEIVYKSVLTTDN